MLKFFQGRNAAATSGAWPKEAIVEGLRNRFDGVSHLGDDRGFSLYGVNDHELNFVVALVEVHGAPDQVVEIGFLSRFVGFDVHQHDVELINRNLHISVSALERGDLILVGGVAAEGAFDATSFSLLLDTWKRDVMIVLQTLQGGLAMMSAFTGARAEKVRAFAENRAPGNSGASAPADLFRAYFGDGAKRALCTACEGRGRLGFVARRCADCDGRGLVRAARRSAG